MFGRVAELRVGPRLWTDRDRVEDAEGDGKANVEFLRLHNGSHHDLLEKKGENIKCNAVDKVIEQISRSDVKLVIISAAWNSKTKAIKNEALLSAINHTSEKLKQGNKVIAFILQTPEFPSKALDCVSLWRLVEKESKCSVSLES